MVSLFPPRSLSGHGELLANVFAIDAAKDGDGVADYVLPPPAQGKDLAEPPPLKKTQDGDDKAGQANGSLAVDEEAQLAERTGWAPRFGSGDADDADSQQDTNFDHQTWVEGKLDDKFFGGRYAHLSPSLLHLQLSSSVWI
jgi:hypothetical protein